MKSLTVAAAVLAFLSSASLGRAQQCDTVKSRTSMSEFAGAAHPFRSGCYAGASEFPGLARALDGLHVRTRAATVRRQILFAPGDTVDTLAVGESIRRLRRLRYLRDVEAEAAFAAGSGLVDLVLTTRDDWSVKPKVQVRSPGSQRLG